MNLLMSVIAIWWSLHPYAQKTKTVNDYDNPKNNMHNIVVIVEETAPQISEPVEIPVVENCNQWDVETMVMIDNPEVYLENGASYEDYLEDFEWLYWNYNLCANADISPLPNPQENN